MANYVKHRMSYRSKVSKFGIEDNVSEKFVDEARRIFWTTKENVLFGDKNISYKDHKHWDMSCKDRKTCNTCMVLLPARVGWFSDERIHPMTSTSHMLYQVLGEFNPYKICASRIRTTYKTPLKLLDVVTREIIRDTNDKEYFTVSHVWTSGNFGSAPFSEKNKGYPWLRRMSKLLKVRYAWVDTCCIDQNNTAEKQHEISNMRDYYANAHSCAVLFDSTDFKDIDTFIANMRLLAIKALDNPYRRLGHVWALASIFYSNLLTDVWFTRIWTIQEIMLSRNVVVDSSCGLVNLLELLRHYHMLVESLGRMAMCSDDMDQVRTLSYYLYNVVDTYNMRNILELCMGREVTNSHDYVYGVLGLLPNISIKVDYAAPLEDVIVSLFRETTDGGDLSWISWVGSSCLENYSFVPVIGSSIFIDIWDTSEIYMKFDSMAIKSGTSVEVIGTARWNGVFMGITNICAVLHMLGSEERLCESCLVMKFCNNGCCKPHAVRSTMIKGNVLDNFCTNCDVDEQQDDKCQQHMEELFAKQHNCSVLLMKTEDNKYLIGRINGGMMLERSQVEVFMFGNRGWIMDRGDRIGIVSSASLS
jgi:hypothetical protein